LATALNYLRAGSKPIEAKKRLYDNERARDTTHRDIGNAIDRLRGVLGAKALGKKELMVQVEDLMQREVTEEGKPNTLAIADKLGKSITDQYVKSLKSPAGVAGIANNPETILRTLRSLEMALPAEGKEKNSAFAFLGRDISDDLNQRYITAASRNGFQRPDYKLNHTEVAAGIEAKKTGNRVIYRQPMSTVDEMDMNQIVSFLSDVSGGSRDYIRGLIGTWDTGLLGAFIEQRGGTKENYAAFYSDVHGTHRLGIPFSGEDWGMTPGTIERHLITTGGLPVTWESMGRSAEAGNIPGVTTHTAYGNYRTQVMTRSPMRRAFIEHFESQTNRDNFITKSLSHLPDGAERDQSIDYLNRLFDTMTTDESKEALVSGGVGLPWVWTDPKISVGLQAGVAAAPQAYADAVELLGNRHPPAKELQLRRTHAATLKSQAEGELLVARDEMEKYDAQIHIKDQTRVEQEANVDHWFSQPEVMRAVDNHYMAPFRRVLLSALTPGGVDDAEALTPLNSVGVGEQPHTLKLDPKSMAQRFSHWFDGYQGGPGGLDIGAKTPGFKKGIEEQIATAASPLMAIRHLANGIRKVIDKSEPLAKWLPTAVGDPRLTYGPDFAIDLADYSNEAIEYLGFRNRQATESMLDADPRLAQGHSALTPRMQAHLSEES